MRRLLAFAQTGAHPLSPLGSAHLTLFFRVCNVLSCRQIVFNVYHVRSFFFSEAKPPDFVNLQKLQGGFGKLLEAFGRFFLFLVFWTVYIWFILFFFLFPFFTFFKCVNFSNSKAFFKSLNIFCERFLKSAIFL